MARRIASLALLVRDYDEAISFFSRALRFRLLEDTPMGDGKRWVVMEPRGSSEASLLHIEEGSGEAPLLKIEQESGGALLLLARAANPEQASRIGDQTGGRVFLFLHTDDFWDDYNHMKAQGVHFIEEPRHEPYGMVVVFLDLYGNKWDLIQPASA